MTIEELKNRKRELGYTNEQVAALSGVPLSTVQKIFGGSTVSPRYQTLHRLEQALLPAPADRNDILPPLRSISAPETTGSLYDKQPLYSQKCSSQFIREPEAAYSAEKKQGTYTLEDYYALPEERRVELIDGVIYDMGAPSAIHQDILGELFYLFRTFVKNNKGACRVYAAPVDVQLDSDDRTMVQPDLMVICDRKKILRRCLYGAPDFVMEILSPSTRRKDLTIKTAKYAEAGVREYWIIDTDKEKLMVFDFEADDFPTIYTFDDTVPVKIWGGEFSISFPEIRDEMREVYGDPEE